MILRGKPRVWDLLFAMRGSIVPRIAPQIAGITILSMLVVALQESGTLRLPAVAAFPFSLIGIALSIFAAFRNTVCYDRWWEARRVMGQMLVDVRSLGRQALAHLGPVDDASARRIALRGIGFAYGLRDYLRGGRPGQAALLALDPAERPAIAAARNPPNLMLCRLTQDIVVSLGAVGAPAHVLQIMEERIVSLSIVLAAAERIKAVPVPYAYSLLLHRTAYLFCLLLPFGLAPVAGFWTPIVTAIVCYTFFGLDALGGELEAPFSLEQNALPLDAMTRGLDIAIREMLGETELPDDIEPVDYVLH